MLQFSTIFYINYLIFILFQHRHWLLRKFGSSTPWSLILFIYFSGIDHLRFIFYVFGILLFVSTIHSTSTSHSHLLYPEGTFLGFISFLLIFSIPGLLAMFFFYFFLSQFRLSNSGNQLIRLLIFVIPSSGLRILYF